MRTPNVYYGYSLIELLIAVGISTLLLAGGIASYTHFSNNQKVKIQTQELKTALRLAQNNALSGIKECSGEFLGWQAYKPGSTYECEVRSVCDDLSGSLDFGPPVSCYTLNSVVNVSDFDVMFNSLTGQATQTTIDKDPLSDPPLIITISTQGINNSVGVYANGVISDE